MRTTINLDDDVLAAIQQLQRERSIGLSDAVNLLARVGLTVRTERPAFVQRTAPIGVTVDLRKTGSVLELLDGR